MTRALLKQALDALEAQCEIVGPLSIRIRPAITNIRAYLDSTKEQEPVAWMNSSGSGAPVVTEALLQKHPECRADFDIPLYLHPSPEDIDALRKDACDLWKALQDLSFHCDGVITTKAPPREIYNATFHVMNGLRNKYSQAAIDAAAKGVMEQHPAGTGERFAKRAQRIINLEAEVAKYKQQRDDLLAAAENLIKVKGRYHTEQAFKQLEEAVAKVKP